MPLFSLNGLGSAHGSLRVNESVCMQTVILNDTQVFCIYFVKT